MQEASFFTNAIRDKCSVTSMVNHDLGSIKQKPTNTYKYSYIIST